MRSCGLIYKTPFGPQGNLSLRPLVWRLQALSMGLRCVACDYLRCMCIVDESIHITNGCIHHICFAS